MVAFALDFPTYGQVRTSNELRKQGVFVSPSGVRSIWLRHALANMKQRLTALERKSVEDGLVLTEGQVCRHWNTRKKMTWPVAKEKRRIHLGRGYLGSQDTFYVGTIKGVGRIYQQTFVDIHSKRAEVKLYTTKTYKLPTCATIVHCRFSLHSAWGVYAYALMWYCVLWQGRVA